MAYVIRVLREVTGKNTVPEGAFYLRQELEERDGTTYAHLHVGRLAEATRFPDPIAAARERDETILSAYDCVAVPEEDAELPTAVMQLLDQALTEARKPG